MNEAVTQVTVSEALTYVEVEKKANSLPEQAKAHAIKNNEQYILAGNFLLGIKAVRKEIDDTFNPIIEKAHQAHKEAINQKRKVETPVAEAEQIIKSKIADYTREMERIREEEEARLRQLALKDAQERQLNEALLAEQLGNKEEVEAILAEPVMVPTVIVPKQEAPKGISITKVWKFRIKDEAKIPREYMIPDMVKIGAVVRALKDRANVPGIEVYADDSVRGRV
jgi:hypothetical protein